MAAADASFRPSSSSPSGSTEAVRRRLANSTTLLGMLLLIFTGCAHDRATIEKNLMHDRDPATRNVKVADQYRVGYPDELEIRIASHAELTGKFPIDLDGTIALGLTGRIRVQGKTPPEIAHLLADDLGRQAEQVEVRVASFNSQRIYLFGQVIGQQRAVPYQGQETVVHALQRVGGITPGAEPDDIYVVRPPVADAKRPEVFHVDLDAIVVKHDQRTNLRLLPNDQIFVGETRQSRIEK